MMIGIKFSEPPLGCSLKDNNQPKDLRVEPPGISRSDRGNSGLKRWASGRLSRWTLRQLQSKCWDAQDAEESRPALQAMCRLRSTLCVAQEVGKGLE